METIVKTYNLTKKYKDSYAVKELNMTINKGEIYGFLGKNGAGKTTTICMLLDLIKPTNGEIELFGKNNTVNQRELFSRIGSIVEFPGFYPNLTAYENLEIHRKLMGVQSNTCIDDCLKLVGILKAKDKKVKQFSLGMKQRLGIARALLHQPELLILDEPTNGLDPVGIREIRELILDLCHKREVTVLISSHILSEVQQLATKIGIIHQGVLLEEINYQELHQKNRTYLQIRVSDDKKATRLLEQQLKISDYIVWEKGVLKVYEYLNEPEFVNRLLIEHSIDVKELKLAEDTLEDYFIKLTGGEIK